MAEEALLEQGKILLDFINETLPRMIIFNLVYRDKNSINKIKQSVPAEFLELLPKAFSELENKSLISINGDSVTKTDYGITLYNIMCKDII